MRPRPNGPGRLILGLGVAAVLLVVCVVLANGLLARDRGAERAAAGQAASYSPPAISTPQPPLVSVVADELAGAVPGTDAADDGPPSWISIVPERISVRLSPFIYPGSGYIVRGFGDDPNGTTFVTRAQRISDSTAVTVFMGGVADQAESRIAVSKAATLALADARKAAPRSRLIVVGPVWPTADPPARVLAVRDALRSAAGIAEATWIDPIARGWLAGSTAQWDATRSQPTASGQRQLGTLMTRVIDRTLQ